MNSFEISENTFQIIAMFAGMTIAGIVGFKYRSRRAIVLSCAYASFMLGTLFYTLHMTIIGDIPRIFYVSDISWMASYLFLLLLMSMRKNKSDKPVRFEILPAVISAVTFAIAVYNEILGPSLIMSCGFGIIAGGIVYYAALNIMDEKKAEREIRRLDVGAAAAIFLQNLLYFVSEYTTDYTSFNLYFAVDILLTLNYVSLSYFLGKEVKQDGTY